MSPEDEIPAIEPAMAPSARKSTRQVEELAHIAVSKVRDSRTEAVNLCTSKGVSGLCQNEKTDIVTFVAVRSAVTKLVSSKLGSISGKLNDDGENSSRRILGMLSDLPETFQLFKAGSDVNGVAPFNVAMNEPRDVLVTDVASPFQVSAETAGGPTNSTAVVPLRSPT